jgi:hypothetical protein
MTRPFKEVLILTDFLLDSIEHAYTDVSIFLINNNYKISSKAKNTAIRLNQFTVIDKMLKVGMLLDEQSIQAAIQSNNIKMVRYIDNRIKPEINIRDLYCKDIAMVDNVDIYKHYWCMSPLIISELNILFDYKSVNILEFMRWQYKRRDFEQYCLQYARLTNNLDILNYFNDNDYGNH